MPPKKTAAQAKKPRSKKPRDFVYENAPLVEVIVDVYWNIQNLPSLRGAIDPNFMKFEENFRRAAKRAGFGVEEAIVPPEAPLEFFGGQVTRRFRPKSNGWPLFQTGPGVMSVNIVPPYDGWAGFKPTIRKGFDLLFKTHPGLNKKSVNISRLQLRYIDAFDKSFGMLHPGEFVRDQLNLGVSVPPDLKKTANKRDSDIQYEGRLLMLLEEPAGAGGIISWSKGKNKNLDAVIVQLDVRTAKKKPPQTPRSMMAWLDKAHDVSTAWFHGILSPPIKKILGKKIPL